MRALLAVLALAALTAGCGSSGSRSEQGAPEPGSLEALWRQSGEAVALIPRRAHQAKFEGSVSVRELERAMRADLH